MLNYTFFQDVERPLKYVKYSDTDSLYINVDYKPKTTQDGVDKAFEIGKLINDAISEYVNTNLTKKMGIDPSYNKIDFKTECLMDSFILLSVKKNYAYKLLAKEGKILSDPEISYTGIPVVKTDSPKFTQQFIRDIVEKIALSRIKKSDMLTHLSKLLETKKSELHDHIMNFNISQIGSPKIWGSRDYVKDPQQIVSMKLWNTITESKEFTPASSGLSIPITIIDKVGFEHKIETIKYNNQYALNDTNFDNITAIVVPHNYKPDVLKTLFNANFIDINEEKCWELTYNKIAKRIVEVIVNHSKT